MWNHKFSPKKHPSTDELELKIEDLGNSNIESLKYFFKNRTEQELAEILEREKEYPNVQKDYFKNLLIELFNEYSRIPEDNSQNQLNEDMKENLKCINRVKKIITQLTGPFEN